MTKRTFNKQIADKAAEWAVRFDDGPLSEADRAALVAWLKESPAHVDEFLTSLALFEGAALAGSDMSVEVGDLLAEAQSNVVSLSEAGSEVSTSPVVSVEGRARPWWRRGAVAAAAALVIVSVGSFFVLQDQADLGPQPMVVATELGEQRSVTLEDGSIVYVNTQSQISALYTEDARTVELLYGEALFDVEPDPTRPFRVIAGDTVAEALGTTFNVRFIDDEAKVSVVEGTVAFGKQDAVFDAVEREEDAVLDTASSVDLGRIEAGRVILKAGQTVDLAEAAVSPRVATRNVEAVTAWTTRKLVFNEDDLAAIAEEFNRYNRQRLVVSPGLVGGERFSGTFAADDPESFVDFLELTAGIEAVTVGGEIRLRQAQ